MCVCVCVYIYIYIYPTALAGDPATVPAGDRVLERVPAQHLDGHIHFYISGNISDFRWFGGAVWYHFYVILIDFWGLVASLAPL